MRTRPAGTAAALLAAVMLGGCMDSDSDEGEPAQPAAASETEVRLVDCGDWRSADDDRREAIVAALREFAGGVSGSPGGRGATLDDADAERLFDSYCSRELARGFKLYKLYTRAASFGAR